MSRSEPTLTERTQAGPKSGVPTTISVEPPPTSQTAITPSFTSARATAPAYASLPSSSGETMRTPPLVALASERRSRSGSPPCRPGAVTTVSIVSTLSLAAARE